MSTAQTLRTLFEGYAEAYMESQGRADPQSWVDRILDEYPQINDHEGERGYWNTVDENQQIDGPFASFDEALEAGHGYPYWVEEDE